MSRTATAWQKIESYDAIKKQLSASFWSICSLSSKACEYFQQQQLHLGWFKEAVLAADSCPLPFNSSHVCAATAWAAGNCWSQVLIILPGEVSPKSLLSSGALCPPGLAQGTKWGCSVVEAASDPISVMRAAMRAHCAASPSADRFCWVQEKTCLLFLCKLYLTYCAAQFVSATRSVICWEQAGRQRCRSLSSESQVHVNSIGLIGIQTEGGFQALFHIFYCLPWCLS